MRPICVFWRRFQERVAPEHLSLTAWKRHYSNIHITSASYAQAENLTSWLTFVSLYWYVVVVFLFSTQKSKSYVDGRVVKDICRLESREGYKFRELAVFNLKFAHNWFKVLVAFIQIGGGGESDFGTLWMSDQPYLGMLYSPKLLRRDWKMYPKKTCYHVAWSLHRGWWVSHCCGTKNNDKYDSRLNLNTFSVNV